MAATALSVAVPQAFAAPSSEAAPASKSAPAAIEPQARATFERALTAYRALPALRFEAREFVAPKDGVRTLTPVVGILGRTKFKVLTYEDKSEGDQDAEQLRKVSTLDGQHFYVWERAGGDIEYTLEKGELTSALVTTWLMIPFTEVLYDFWTGKNPLNDSKLVSAKFDVTGKKEDKVTIERALVPNGRDQMHFYFERSTGLLSRIELRRPSPENLTMGLEIQNQRVIQPKADTFQWSPK